MEKTRTILNTSMIKPRVSDVTVVYRLLIMSSFLTQTITFSSQCWFVFL